MLLNFSIQPRAGDNTASLENNGQKTIEFIMFEFFSRVDLKGLKEVDIIRLSLFSESH